MIRFTLRDAMWLAALALVALCWLLDHENLSRDQSEQLKAAKAAWAEAALKDNAEVREKIDHIVGKLMAKFPDKPELTE